MKKINSKKAFTLVELVVTIAITAIASGFAIGIFASVMKNYSTASITAIEQQEAVRVEDFILTNARAAYDVLMVKSSLSTDRTGYVKQVSTVMTTDKKEGGFITVPRKANNSDTCELKTFYGIKTGSVVSQEATIRYSRVKYIDFKIKRHKTVKGDADQGSFMFLEYKIVMESDYSISGEVTLNNCLDMKPSNTAGKYFDNYTTVRVGSTTEETGIAFVRTKPVATT